MQMIIATFVIIMIASVGSAVAGIDPTAAIGVLLSTVL